MRVHYLCMVPALLAAAFGGWAQTASSHSTEVKGIAPEMVAHAKAGDSDAEWYLSLRYFDLGNQKEACKWVRASAQNGNPVAQVTLAGFYEFGSSGSNLCAMAKDYTLAAFWYRKAAEQGGPGAQFALGDLYMNGRGVQRDNAQASVWYRKAAEQGNVGAQYDLSLFYAVGVGVPQDYSEAYFWASLAAAATNNSDGTMSVQNLTSWRDSVAAYLTKTELLNTQERARKWFEEHPTTVAP